LTAGQAHQNIRNKASNEILKSISREKESKMGSSHAISRMKNRRRREHTEHDVGSEDQEKKLKRHIEN
jgi:hypothetical protein